MRETHSPTPWTIGEETIVEGMGATLIMSAPSARLEGPVIVAAVLGIDNGPYPDAGSHDANGQLIILAPQLLAALRHLCDVAGSVEQPVGVRGAITQARQLIAAADMGDLGGSVTVEPMGEDLPSQEKGE